MTRQVKQPPPSTNASASSDPRNNDEENVQGKKENEKAINQLQ